MLKFDWNKVEQVKVVYDEAAENEIQNVEQEKGEELSTDDMEVIRAKYTNQCNQVVRRLILSGPKSLYRHGFLLGDGWREGFTRSPLSKRTAARRKKNKAARLARRKQRK